MRLLVLGGTAFLGARFVELALERGHEVTLFNRGRTKAGRFGPAVEAITGDRDPEVEEGLTRLAERVAGERFDAVIDISGYLPRHVRASAALLAPCTSTYLFVSTVSVYQEPVAPGADEGAELIELEDPDVEEITPATYGGLKVLCERVVREACGDATLFVRPGIIGGREDFTDRLTFWPWVAQATLGGGFIAPGDGSDLTEVIDARDVAAFMLQLAEEGAPGVRARTGHDTFNTAGAPTPMREVIQAALDVALEASGAPQAESPVPHWTSLERLESLGIQPWVDLPLWMPGSAKRGGILTVSSDRALAAGLERRALIETVRDALAGHDMGQPPRAGISLERLRDALAELA